MTISPFPEKIPGDRRLVFLQLIPPHKAHCSACLAGQGLYQCQEDHSGFHSGEDALRLNLMSCGPLTWPWQAMGAAGHPPLCNHISGAFAAQGPLKPDPTALLNHISSKQQCPDKKKIKMKCSPKGFRVIPPF